MRSDQGEAFVLRRKGKSYQEISAELGVAKSTLSNWFKGIDFSIAIRKELATKAARTSAARISKLNKTRGIALEVQYEIAQKEALEDMKLYRHIPLFSAGLALYWGEGDRVDKHNIRLSNTDPRLLKVFLAFLTEFCDISVNKIALAMYLYQDLDEFKCRRYWAKQLGLKRFHKTQILPSRHKTKRLTFGTCGLVTTNSRAKRKLLVWIDRFPEMVLNTVPKKKGRGHG